MPGPGVFVDYSNLQRFFNSPASLRTQWRAGSALNAQILHGAHDPYFFRHGLLLTSVRRSSYKVHEEVIFRSSTPGSVSK